MLLQNRIYYIKTYTFLKIKKCLKNKGQEKLFAICKVCFLR